MSSKLGLVQVETWNDAPMYRCALCRTTATKADAMFRHLVSTHHVNPIMALIETRPDPAPASEPPTPPSEPPTSAEQSPEPNQAPAPAEITPAATEQSVVEQAGSPDSESSAPETPAESEHAT